MGLRGTGPFAGRHVNVRASVREVPPSSIAADCARWRVWYAARREGPTGAFCSMRMVPNG
jgi:hypothetical protein